MQYGWTFLFGNLVQSHLISLLSIYGGERYSFPSLVLPNVIVNFESVVGVIPDGSCVVIRYQVNDFPCVWLVECFLMQSQIYPGFTGKVSTLT